MVHVDSSRRFPLYSYEAVAVLFVTCHIDQTGCCPHRTGRILLSAGLRRFDGRAASKRVCDGTEGRRRQRAGQSVRTTYMQPHKLSSGPTAMRCDYISIFPAPATISRLLHYSRAQSEVFPRGIQKSVKLVHRSRPHTPLEPVVDQRCVAC